MAVESAAPRIANVHTRPLEGDVSVCAGLCLAVRQRQTEGEKKKNGYNLHRRAAEAHGEFSVTLHCGISDSNSSVSLFSPIRAKSCPRLGELVRKTLATQAVN